MMPEMNGYQFCKAFKSDAKLKEVPVILVTSLSDSQDVIRGLACGADNFIRKPYDERYLLSRVEYLLMHVELRKSQKMQLGIEIRLGNQNHFITAERQQILDLLISTYEQLSISTMNLNCGTRNWPIPTRCCMDYSASRKD
ncbi:MAG: response regulator [Nitrosomonadales bacterium]